MDPFAIPAPPCPGCGLQRAADDPHGLGWSSVHSPDGVEFLCPGCTRAEIRQIEAGLPVVRVPAA
jgi:hypothetical protein